jgi:acyl-CoA synthetase (AMP-forming)/AMP-acid ligase II
MGLQKNARVLLLPGDRAEFLFSVLAGALGGYQLVLISQKATPDEVQHIRNVSQPDMEWDCGRVGEPMTEVNGDSFFQNVLVIFFTSGTTSLPKGVCHNFETLCANADAFNQGAELDESVRMLHVMPTGYMAGLLNTFLSPIIAGGCVVLGEVFDVRSALSFWETAQSNAVNAVWLSPTMVATLIPLCRGEKIPVWARSNLKHVFVGTAPLHSATRIAFRKRIGVDCLESYGMTECMFVAVNLTTTHNEGHSVGHLLSGVKGEIRGPDGLTLPAGQEGDLWLRSDYSLVGYLDPAGGKSVSAFDHSGWLNTGDIGRLEEDGRLTITGRRKDLIIHGGTNVSPKAVEDVLLDFAGVQEAAVMGAPHPFWGEEVLACLILDSNVRLDELALRAHCCSRLNPDAVPSRFLILKEFPRSNSGKVQKHMLSKI